MPEELEILELVCRKLEEGHIPYMLTGSLAANFYAVPRMTRDIDIVIEIFELDTSKFLQIFQDDFYIEKRSITEAIRHETMFNIIHNASILKIDFVIRKDSLYRSTEFARRRRIDLGDSQIWIVAPEDLILSKLLWAKDSLSDFQLRDVENLLSSAENLDTQYIDEWVQKLGIDQVYKLANANG